MHECFKDWVPRKETAYLLSWIRRITTEYEDQGYVLTLRQLYYQLVSKDLIQNSERSYKNIGNIVNRGRLAGFIDWRMIEDRARVLTKNTHWESPGEVLRAAARGYYLSRWTDQDDYVEVWCEKDAVSNIIEPVCREHDVPFMANRGYSSQSAMYRAGRRFQQALTEGKIPYVIYLGDHDPSGIDMSRDIEDRLAMFSYEYVVVERIALNMNQVRKYQPPENPAKISDSRAKGYIKKYGYSSWELDALDPSTLSQLVKKAIKKHINVTLWKKIETVEERGRNELLKVADNWRDNG